MLGFTVSNLLAKEVLPRLFGSEAPTTFLVCLAAGPLLSKRVLLLLSLTAADRRLISGGSPELW